MKKLAQKFLFIIFICIYSTGYADETLKVFNYYNGLMEYYAGYITKISDKKIEEAYILFYPDRYEANEKNPAKKNEDINNVKIQLEKAITEIRKNSHEYKILMRAEFVQYDLTKKVFKFDILNTYSCLDLDPLSNEPGFSSNENSVIARGLLFNKINKIKLFFINADEFNILKYPYEKANILLRERAGRDGEINKEVFVIINVEILPGNNNEYMQKLKSITDNIGLQGLESNYYMIAKIKSIEIYNDESLKNKIGNMENIYRKF